MKLKIFILPLVFSVAFLGLMACSSNPVNSRTAAERSIQDDVHDPLQVWNRRIFAFNTGLDKHLIKPLAKGYHQVVPDPINTFVSNFFSNLGEAGHALNNVLQLKPMHAVNDVQRLVYNSTFGFLGILDIASEMGLEKHDEDFGQTLAVWGVPAGRQIHLPFFGPSSLRDSAAKFALDTFTAPRHYSTVLQKAYALELLDKRADLLSAEDAFSGFADDQYIALRNVWIQNRNYLIFDGRSQQADTDSGDLIDELEALD